VVKVSKIIGGYDGDKVNNSYEIGDFDHLIYEPGGIYEGNFCIIPIDILIKMGIVAVSGEFGKTGFSINLPDGEDDWATPYWNNFEQLLN
jgi:hypothetical protein